MNNFIKRSFILLAGIFYACEDVNDAQEFRESISVVLAADIPESAVLGGNIPIGLVISGSNSCASFSRFETELSGDTTKVVVYQKQAVDDICALVLIEIVATINLGFDQIGKKYVEFDGIDGVILDSLIVVN